VRFLTLFGPWRRAAAETVWLKMKSVYESPCIEQVSVIAHSFGTWIVVHILRTHSAKLYRVILYRSVLDTQVKWEQLKDQVQGPSFPDAPNYKIVNDCGTKDVWPHFAKFTT
jgi:hypothetical protein